MRENDEKLRELLKEAFRTPEGAGLERDLWPRMLRRLDERAGRRWLDWLLAAAAAAAMALFPQVIPTLLYHM